MSNDHTVVFPNELLENFTLETTFFSPANEQIGVAAFSEVEDNSHIIRLYQLMLSVDRKEYHVIQEMAAFSYQNRSELVDFLERLPSMSAIEMLMMFNPPDLYEH